MVHKKYFLLSLTVILLLSHETYGGLRQSEQEQQNQTRWQRFKEKVKNKAAETKKNVKERWTRFRENVNSKATAAKEKVKGLFQKKKPISSQEEKIYIPSQIEKQEEEKRMRENQHKMPAEQQARFNEKMRLEETEKVRRTEEGKAAHETTLGGAFEDVPL